MSAAEHEGRVVMHPVGHGYTAPRIECSCGWHGPTRERPTQTHIDQARHLADVGVRPKEKTA